VHFLRLLRNPSLKWILAVALLAVAAPRTAQAAALLLIEADSGKVLQADNATMPWYPASLSKLMTAYVTLTAVKEGRVSLDTLLTVSPTAASQSPSKMGLRPGTQVTVDNALKMMLVKSANDMAVVLAEGVGGSIDGFAAMMNQTARKLGMTQTSYVNPNRLPADGQITSARDMAILARAIIRDLPEYEYFVHIPSIRFGRRITQNFNKLIGRYPGADGFKTGFICASGYNLVASATRDGKRLIAVVLGASSGRMRAVRAAQLLDRGFAGNGLAWLRPSLGTVENLAPIDASPPNLHEEMCGPKRKRPASDEDEDTIASSAGGSATNGEGGSMSFFATGLQAAMPKPSELLGLPAAPSEPVVVYTGPTKTGAALAAAVEADSEKMQPAAKRGKRTRVVIKVDKKSDTAADAKSEAKGEAKGDAKKDGNKSDSKQATAKPARHANAKPDNAGAKPAGAKSAAAKPADKQAAAKPAAKPKAATKPKSDAKQPAS